MVTFTTVTPFLRRRSRRSPAALGDAVRTLLTLLALLTSLVLLSARDAAAQTPELPPAHPDSVTVAAQRAAAVAIAVGDRVGVRIWREPGLSDSVTVDERGEIVLPRLGVLPVAGRTIATLQDTLRSYYSAYLRNPSIQITVFRRVGVQGEVKKPNLYFIDVTMTLREVLALAGGVTENGNPNDIVIVREGQQVPLGRWKKGGPLSAELRSGDQVVVGRRSWLARNALAAVSTAGLVLSVLLPVLRSK